MSKISVRCDRELDTAIDAYARANSVPDMRSGRLKPMSRSQAVREILRQALTDAEPVTRGWHEGFKAGYRDSQSAVQGALSGAHPPVTR